MKPSIHVNASRIMLPLPVMLCCHEVSFIFIFHELIAEWLIYFAMLV